MTRFYDLRHSVRGFFFSREKGTSRGNRERWKTEPVQQVKRKMLNTNCILLIDCSKNRKNSENITYAEKTMFNPPKKRVRNRRGVGTNQSFWQEISYGLRLIK